MSIKNLKETDIPEFISRLKEINTGQNKKACVITLGCQQNEADSEKIRAMARDMGYEITDDPFISDLIVVNTCAVRRHAELKALSIVGNFKPYKKQKPDLIVGICGCMAAEPHMAETVKKSFAHVSFTLEPSMLYRLPELVFRAYDKNKRSFVCGCDEGDIIEGIDCDRVSKHRAWVSIMYGCNNFCSYCIVPYVRGRERSRNSREIIEECKSLVAAGYKEITLLGQNVNSYKADISFAELLKTVAEIPGDFILRFMTSHPKDVSDELIEVFGKYSGKIAPTFHLPLQSGSDRILKQMNRTYNTEKYLQTVDKIRAVVPNVALSSDIIIGFPGESEEDFENTLSVLKRVRYDMVFSFIYSKREGTVAAKLENQIPDEITRERMRRLLDMQCNISKEINETYVGNTERVLVDSFEMRDGDRIYSSRTLTNKLVHFKSDKELIGSFVEVKINRAGAFDLFGEEI